MTWEGRTSVREKEILTSTPRSRKSNQNILVFADLLLERRVRKHDHLGGHAPLGLWLDARLVGDEGGQTVEVPAAAIVARFVALAVEPFEGWEALHAEPSPEIFVFVGVDLGDGDLVFGELEVLREFFIYGSEVLAMTAPRSKELDEGGLP